MEPRPEPQAETPGDDVRWLAMLIRRALLLIVAGIEARYNLANDRK